MHLHKSIAFGVSQTKHTYSSHTFTFDKFTFPRAHFVTIDLNDDKVKVKEKLRAEMLECKWKQAKDETQRSAERKTKTNVQFVFFSFHSFQHFIWHLHLQSRAKKRKQILDLIFFFGTYSCRLFLGVFFSEFVTRVNYGDDALHAFMLDLARIETSFVTPKQAKTKLDFQILYFNSFFFLCRRCRLLKYFNEF